MTVPRSGATTVGAGVTISKAKALFAGLTNSLALHGLSGTSRHGFYRTRSVVYTRFLRSAADPAFSTFSDQDRPCRTGPICGLSRILAALSRRLFRKQWQDLSTFLKRLFFTLCRALRAVLLPADETDLPTRQPPGSAVRKEPLRVTRRARPDGGDLVPAHTHLQQNDSVGGAEIETAA